MRTFALAIRIDGNLEHVPRVEAFQPARSEHTVGYLLARWRVIKQRPLHGKHQYPRQPAPTSGVATRGAEGRGMVHVRQHIA